MLIQKGAQMSERKTYTTRTRTEILNYLKLKRSMTVSVTDIREYLAEAGIEANSTTVYRYLDKLCAEHAVIKYPDLSGEKAVYEYAGEDHHCLEHLHLKCVRCGRVQHLDCDFMDAFRAHILEHHHFRLQCAGGLLYGLCEACAAEDNAGGTALSEKAHAHGCDCHHEGGAEDGE